MMVTGYGEVPLTSYDNTNSVLRYFSRNVGSYRLMLYEAGMEEQANDMIDRLWTRLIKACYEYGVPLTKEAEAQVGRLGL